MTSISSSINTTINICLIGGSGRSGTTLLRNIFSNHPQVVDVPEWRCLIDPDGLIDFYNTFYTGWSPYLYDLKIKRLSKILKKIAQKSCFADRLINKFISNFPMIEKKLKIYLLSQYADINILQACPHYLEYVEKLLEELIEFRYQGSWTGMQFMQTKSLVYSSRVSQDSLAKIIGKFYFLIVQDILKHQKAKYYVEKNTWNILWYDKIIELLPKSKLVHIYRDPRDVVASYTRQKWMPSNPLHAAQCYKTIMERWWEIRDSLPPNSYYEISLEALVLNPESVLRDICSFWQIEWHKSLLDVDLSHSHSGRWRKEFTNEQKQQINLILHDQIQHMGYQL